MLLLLDRDRESAQRATALSYRGADPDSHAAPLWLLACNGSAATDSIALARFGAPLVAQEDTALSNLRRRGDAEFLGTGEAEDYVWFPAFLLGNKLALAGRLGEARAAGPTGIACDLAARKDLAAGTSRRPARTDRPSSTTQPPARGSVRRVHDDAESSGIKARTVGREHKLARRVGLPPLARLAFRRGADPYGTQREVKSRRERSNASAGLTADLRKALLFGG